MNNENSVTTLKDELDYCGFDWNTGVIICYTDTSIGKSKCIISNDNPILTKKYYGGYGAANIPHFRACDDIKIYFPYEYDGATSVKWVYRDVLKYLEIDENIDCI